MKKAVLILLVLVLVLSLSACGEKTAENTEKNTKQSISKETFIEEAKKLGFSVTEIEPPKAYLASTTKKKKKENINSYFYTATDDNLEKLKIFYKSQDDKMELLSSSAMISHKAEGENWELHITTDKGFYTYIMRIDSTILYMYSPDVSKSVLDDLAKQLGYVE